MVHSAFPYMSAKGVIASTSRLYFHFFFFFLFMNNRLIFLLIQIKRQIQYLIVRIESMIFVMFFFFLFA